MILSCRRNLGPNLAQSFGDNLGAFFKVVVIGRIEDCSVLLLATLLAVTQYIVQAN
ncbi:Uncharacterised protein [Kocuria rosea]|nr:Uncharacterised protein [Kocuria rosea]